MTRYLSLAECLWLSEQVTGITSDVLSQSSRIELADSALHAPMSGFGDEDFYPDLFDKAAVLCWRLARNHPLPDGNKRAAWASLVVSSRLVMNPVSVTNSRASSAGGCASASLGSSASRAVVVEAIAESSGRLEKPGRVV